MSPVRKPKTKVVDNLKTQLTDLLASLDRLHDTINDEMKRFGSDFDEINTILVEGFRNVLDQKPPIDVVESASSSGSGESDTDQDDEDRRHPSFDHGDDCEEEKKEQEQEEKDATEKAAQARQAEAEKLVRMIQSWGSR